MAHSAEGGKEKKKTKRPLAAILERAEKYGGKDETSETALAAALQRAEKRTGKQAVDPKAVAEARALKKAHQEHARAMKHIVEDQLVQVENDLRHSDVVEAKQGLKEMFFALAAAVRAEGIEPNDPAVKPAWDKAHREYKKAERIIDDYASAKSPAEQARLCDAFHRSRERFAGPISVGVGEAVGEAVNQKMVTDDVHEGEASVEPEPSAVSVAPALLNESVLEAKLTAERDAWLANRTGSQTEDPHMRALAQEHAIAEKNPNSRAERKAKMMAILDKYGPQSLRSGDEVDSEPVAFNFSATDPTTIDLEKAARTYQTGEFEYPKDPVTRPEAPVFDVTKANMEEAAAIYQGRASLGEVEQIKGRSPETRAAGRAESARLSSNEKQAQEFYFAALRRTQKNKSFFAALGERAGFGTSRDVDPQYNTTALRENWVKARAERASHVLSGIDAHHAERPRGPERAQGRTFIVQEAVFRGEETEQKVRIDALRSRDRGVVEAVWKGYNKLSPRQKQLFGVATAATAGTTAALVGGVPALLTVLAMSGAGAALNTVSLLSKDGSKSQKFSSQASKFATFGGFGGMIGRMLARGTNKQKLQRAENTLAQRNQDALRNPTAFAELSRTRQVAAQDREKVGNRVSTVGAMSALAASAAGGALVGGITRGLEHHGGSHDHASEGSTFGNPSGTEVGHHGHEISARIDQPGEGADKLYADLREQISEAYRRAGERPPVVQEIFKFKTMDEFSQATGFERIVQGGDLHNASGHIDSAVMHMEGDGFKADTFTLSADAKTLTYIDSKGVSHVLMQETPQHEVAVQSQQDGWIPMRNYGPRSETVSSVPEVRAPGAEPSSTTSPDLSSAKAAGAPVGAPVESLQRFAPPKTQPLDTTGV